MAHEEGDAKNSVIGEFMLAFARAPEGVQEQILLYGLRKMQPFSSTLIQPYPMLSHMLQLLNKQSSSGGHEGGGMDQ